MSRRKVAVIGGGAAGMMAAIFAARHGDAVTVFEKNAKIGRKLYITGKGRCNLTNNCDSKTVIENTPTNGRFLYSALNRFSPADTMRFFEENGLPLKTERGHRVFPVSDKAADVVDTLLHTAKREGVQITFQRVDELLIKDGTVIGLKTGTKELPFDKVIVACGGCSYPLTGSTGDGYRFARQAGHTVTTLKPSLVPLETEEIIPAEMVQLLLKNVALTVIDTRQGGKKLYTDFGELQLMKYGVSGAVILSASSHMREMQSGRYRLDIDLLPAAMLMLFLSKAGLSPDKNCSEITRTERRQLLMLLKAFPLTVKGFRPIEEAIVTSGGVSVREIDPKTMASKLVKGLYFAGEVIDIDAYTGGFNLQCAFATGVLAGEA